MRLKRYITALRRYHRSKGHGIHSPFAFKFVLNVLRERLPYYAYEELEELRSKVVDETRSFLRHPRIISYKDIKLLFRITNCFNPKDVLQIGTNYGVSSASMLAVSGNITLHLCEPDVGEYPVTHDVLSHFGNKVNLYGTFATGVEAYAKAVTDNSNPFILVNRIKENEYSAVLSYLFEVRKGSGVIIIRNINKNKTLQTLWEACRDTASTGMTFCNGKMAVIVASPKLQHQNFSLWF